MVPLPPLCFFPVQNTDRGMPSALRMNLSVLSRNFPGDTQYLEMCLLGDCKSSQVNNTIHCYSLKLFSAAFLPGSPFLKISQIKSGSPAPLPVSHSLLCLSPTSLLNQLGPSLSSLSGWTDGLRDGSSLASSDSILVSITPHTSIFFNPSGILEMFLLLLLKWWDSECFFLDPPLFFSHLAFSPRKHLLFSWFHLNIMLAASESFHLPSPGRLQGGHIHHVFSYLNNPVFVVPTHVSFKDLPYQ